MKKNKETYYDVIVTRYKFKTWDIFIKRMKHILQRYEKKFSMVSTKCKRDFALFEIHTFLVVIVENFIYLNNIKNG